jgi:hypothetical protein
VRGTAKQSVKYENQRYSRAASLTLNNSSLAFYSPSGVIPPSFTFLFVPLSNSSTLPSLRAKSPTEYAVGKQTLTNHPTFLIRYV